MSSQQRDLAINLATGLARATAPAPAAPAGVANIIRLGTVASVATRNDGGATYTVVTIDGLQMRCLESYATPVMGDVVVWLNDGVSYICLGPRL